MKSGLRAIGVLLAFVTLVAGCGDSDVNFDSLPRTLSRQIEMTSVVNASVATAEPIPFELVLILDDSSSIRSKKDLLMDSLNPLFSNLNRYNSKITVLTTSGDEIVWSDYSEDSTNGSFVSTSAIRPLSFTAYGSSNPLTLDTRLTQVEKEQRLTNFRVAVDSFWENRIQSNLNSTSQSTPHISCIVSQKFNEYAKANNPDQALAIIGVTDENDTSYFSHYCSTEKRKFAVNTPTYNVEYGIRYIRYDYLQPNDEGTLILGKKNVPWRIEYEDSGISFPNGQSNSCGSSLKNILYDGLVGSDGSVILNPTDALRDGECHLLKGSIDKVFDQSSNRDLVANYCSSGNLAELSNFLSTFDRLFDPTASVTCAPETHGSEMHSYLDLSTGNLGFANYRDLATNANILEVLNHQRSQLPGLLTHYSGINFLGTESSINSATQSVGEFYINLAEQTFSESHFLMSLESNNFSPAIEPVNNFINKTLVSSYSLLDLIPGHIKGRDKVVGVVGLTATGNRNILPFRQIGASRIEIDTLGLDSTIQSFEVQFLRTEYYLETFADE